MRTLSARASRSLAPRDLCDYFATGDALDLSHLLDDDEREAMEAREDNARGWTFFHVEDAPEN